MDLAQTLKNNSGNTERQYYLDWLRVITICLVFLFHCTRFFDADDWHVKNAVVSPVATLFSFFMVQWMMPLFFFISGASTWFALQSKTGGKFLNDRVKRILVPLVFGIFILSPHQVYLERLTHHQFAGSFIDFIPHYFSGMYAFRGNFAWMGLHLWYLLLLFIFSLISLPLLLLLKRRSASRKKSGAMAVVWFLVFVILLALPGCLLSPDSIAGSRVWGGWNIVEHLILFVLGYYAFSMVNIPKTWSAYRYVLLAITVLSTAVNIYLFVNNIRFEFGTLPYFLKIGLRSLVCFAWIFTLLGFAKTRLNYTGKFLKYGNEAVLPFYILHQPVILLIGYFVVQSQLAIGLKYVAIVIVSLSIVMFCYEFIVKRFEVTRYLFGMGRLRKN